MIAETKEKEGLAKGGQPYQKKPTGSPVEPVAPTLAAAGIDKKLSSRSQKLAAIPEPEFEWRLSEWRDKSEHEAL